MIRITKKQLEWMTNYAFDHFTDMTIAGRTDKGLVVYGRTQHEVWTVADNGKATVASKVKASR